MAISRSTPTGWVQQTNSNERATPTGWINETVSGAAATTGALPIVGRGPGMALAGNSGGLVGSFGAAP